MCVCVCVCVCVYIIYMRYDCIVLGYSQGEMLNTVSRFGRKISDFDRTLHTYSVGSDTRFQHEIECCAEERSCMFVFQRFRVRNAAGIAID